MEFSQQHLADDMYLVTFEQQLTVRTVDEMTDLFRSLRAQGARRLIVDLSDVSLIDSRGLNALMEGYRLFGNQSQNFCIVAPQAQPRLLFELTMFDRFFQIYESVEEVLNPEPVA